MLRSAVSGNHRDIAQLLLDRGASILAKSEGKTPLEVAAQGGHLDMAQYLLDRGASIIDGDTQPLRIAVQKSHLDMAQLLWDRGARIDPSDNDAGILLKMAVQAPAAGRSPI